MPAVVNALIFKPDHVVSQQFLAAKRKCNTKQEVLFLLPSKQPTSDLVK